MVESRHPEQWRRPALREPGKQTIGQPELRYPRALIQEPDNWSPGVHWSELPSGSCGCRVAGNHGQPSGAFLVMWAVLLQRQSFESGYRSHNTARHHDSRGYSNSQIGAGPARLGGQKGSSRHYCRCPKDDDLRSALNRTTGGAEGLECDALALTDGQPGRLPYTTEQRAGWVIREADAPWPVFRLAGQAPER